MTQRALSFGWIAMTCIASLGSELVINSTRVQRLTRALRWVGEEIVISVPFGMVLIRFFSVITDLLIFA